MCRSLWSLCGLWWAPWTLPSQSLTQQTLWTAHSLMTSADMLHPEPAVKAESALSPSVALTFIPVFSFCWSCTEPGFMWTTVLNLLSCWSMLWSSRSVLVLCVCVCVCVCVHACVKHKLTFSCFLCVQISDLFMFSVCLDV